MFKEYHEMFDKKDVSFGVANTISIWNLIFLSDIYLERASFSIQQGWTGADAQLRWLWVEIRGKRGSIQNNFWILSAKVHGHKFAQRGCVANLRKMWNKGKSDLTSLARGDPCWKGYNPAQHYHRLFSYHSSCFKLRGHSSKESFLQPD